MAVSISHMQTLVIQDPEMLSQQNQEECQTLSPSWGWGLVTRLSFSNTCKFTDLELPAVALSL